MAQEAEAGQTTAISKRLDDNIALLEERMSIKENFDVILRQITVGNVKMGLLFIDGLTNDQIVTLILSSLTGVKRGELSFHTLDKLFSQHLPYTEVEKVNTLEDVISKV
ncbi:MAG: spore germination protein, partial [Desulfocucumaceae bacterium]